MALDVPTPMELLQLIKDDSVIKLLEKLKCVTRIIPYAGTAMLTVADTFHPDENHEVVIQWLENLSEQLEEDKQELVNLIKMETLYGQHILSIQTAIRSSVDIAKAKNDTERKRYEQMFKDVCAGQKHTMAMDNLVEGLRGKGTPQMNIMHRYYTSTGGNLRKVKTLAKELLKLVYGGFATLFAYETLVRDQRSAEEVLAEYTNRIEEVYENIHNLFDRCKNELRDNIMRELNEILDGNVSNSDAANSLSNLMSEKYCLENYCIVCNVGSPMDVSFKGNYVCSFGRKDRFGVVFYQETTETVFDPEREQQIKTAIESLGKFTWSTIAECHNLIDTFCSEGIEPYGCAVITPKRACTVPYIHTRLTIIYYSTLETMAEKRSSAADVYYWERERKIAGSRLDPLSLSASFPPIPQPTNYLVLWK